MRGEYYDGQTSRRRLVEVEVANGEIIGEGPDASFRWPLKGLRVVDAKDGRVRLAPAKGDGRLVLDAADWEAASGLTLIVVQQAERRGEWQLVRRLAVIGVSLMLVVFVGVPLAAHPLAKITPPRLELAMGRNMASQLTVAFKPCIGDEEGSKRLAELTDRLATNADTSFSIKTIPVHAPMINAFALPGGTILVTDRLIAEARSPDELAGVLAHEIAHVEKRHVMEAVWRSLGLGLILDAVVGGGSGAGQQAVLLASSFAEQRFSRKLESEADERGFELLAANRISTAGVAAFFDRMNDRSATGQAKEAAEWFSTHPDSGRRARAARALARPGAPALSAEDWAAVRRICANSSNRPKAWPLPGLRR